MTWRCLPNYRDRERLEPELFGPLVFPVKIRPVFPPKSFAHPAGFPAGRFVTGAGEAFDVSERFGQQRTVAMLGLPMGGQRPHGQSQRPGRQIGHPRFRQDQKASVLHHQPQPLRPLLVRPANPLLPVDKPQRRRPPDQNGHPAFPVMHDLHQRAPHLATSPKIMLVQKHRAHPVHFASLHRAHGQLLEHYHINFLL